MNGLVPPPDPLGIPAPVLVFQGLMWLTFVLHVIFMNFVLGGTMIVAINDWLFGSTRKIAHANALILKIMPVTLSLAITMGVAPLLFTQVLYGQFFYTANILLGFFWLAILGLVMTGFYLLYFMISTRPASKHPSILTRLLLLVNVVLFLGTAFLFTNNAVISEHPENFEAIYSGQMSWIATDPSLWSRYLHNVLGALAVAGLWCAGISLYRQRYYPADSETSGWLYKNGLLWAKGATMLNILIGFVYLGMLGMDRIRGMMQGGILLWGWGLGVVLAFVLMGLLVAAFIKPDKPVFYWGAVASMFLTLFGMAMGKDLVRNVTLGMQSGYDLSQLQVNFHLSSLLLFLGTFVAGLITLAVMLRILWTCPPVPDEKPASDGEQPGEFNAL